MEDAGRAASDSSTIFARQASNVVLTHGLSLQGFGADDRPDDEYAPEAFADSHDAVDRLLHRLNPRLRSTWLGARHAAQREQEDWWRQSAASLRHLLMKVLDEVAPPDTVRKSEFAVIRDDGSVQRNSQVAWLCRSVPGDEHRRMVQAELTSVVNLINYMSKAVHGDHVAPDRRSFDLLMDTMAARLLHMLSLHFGPE
jgi:hypothetical protein